MSCKTSKTYIVNPGEREFVYALLNYVYLTTNCVKPMESHVTLNVLYEKYNELVSVSSEQQLIAQFIGPILLGFFSLSRT